MAVATTKTTNCANGRQRGISLVEAMVATLLLAILFLGLAFALSRGLVSQRYMNTQSLALLEIRESLQQEENGAEGFCTAPPDLNWLGTIALEDSNNNCRTTPITLSLDGFDDVEVSAQSVEISTTSTGTSQGLFGGDGVIRVQGENYQ